MACPTNCDIPLYCKNSSILNCTATVSQLQSSTMSSNVILSAGAPTFGGGGSFETLDFSLPSYDQATSGGDITKSAPAPAPSSDDAAAKAAAKEEARRAAAEEKEAKKQAEAEAKAVEKAKEEEKVAKKAAAEKAKEERKVKCP